MNKANASPHSPSKGKTPREKQSGKRNRLIWARNLNTILEALRISEWNYLLIGDGSGNNWEYGCAFAALMIERGTDWRDVFFGGFNSGTNQYAELNAYCNPLDWLSELPEVQRTSSGACRIHILSDSEWVVKSGNGDWPRHAHQSTWAKYEAYRRRGFFIDWHWIPGHEGIPANEFCDTIAGAVNKLLKGFDPAVGLEAVQRSSIRRLYPAARRSSADNNQEEK